MFSLCFARVLLLLVSVSWVADAALPALDCEPNGCMNLCIKNFANDVLKILQDGERPDLAILNPYVYTKVAFQSGPALITFKNINFFLTSMSVTEAVFKPNKDLELNFHIHLLSHYSDYEVEAVINNKPVKAKGHAILTFENYKFLYKTKVFSKIINGKEVLQLELGKATLSADNALVGLIDIVSLSGPLTSAEELILRNLFAASSKQYLQAIAEIPPLFVQGVANKVFIELEAS